MTVKVELKDFDEVKTMIEAMSKMVDALGFEQEDISYISSMTQEELHQEMHRRINSIENKLSKGDN